jgi:hypothetical protein
MWCRCLFRGIWLTHNWNRRELWCLGRVLMTFVNLGDGADGSTDLSCAILGELAMTVFASSFMYLLKCCWIADLLWGRVSSSLCFVRSDFGSLLAGDDSPLTVLFTWMSAALFPAIPLCPGVHLMTSFLVSSVWMSCLRLLWNISMR